MEITHDLIAAVTGPGWKFGLSRILVNDEGEGVVFIAGSQEPFAAFAMGEFRGARGKGESEEGPITWRRRGSSCQYKLAKCKVSTETMKGWWEASLAGPPEPEEIHLPEPGGILVAKDLVVNDVPKGSASAVLGWVGQDPDRARAALDAEKSNDRPRVGLTRDLEKILAAEELL